MRLLSSPTPGESPATPASPAARDPGRRDTGRTHPAWMRRGNQPRGNSPARLARSELLRERKQRDVTRPLDRHRQRAPVLGAGPRLAPGLDLAAFGDVAPQAADILVVHLADTIHAEAAHLAARVVASAAAETPAPRRLSPCLLARGRLTTRLLLSLLRGGLDARLLLCLLRRLLFLLLLLLLSHSCPSSIDRRLCRASDPTYRECRRGA